MELSSRLGRLDAKLGDGLEAVLRSHHLRRLGELGWTDALTVPTEPGWWSTRVPVRPGNSLEVLIDGASALPQIESAIRQARKYVHIAGWHAEPDFKLSRGDGAIPLRDLLAEVAQRVPVRLLLWAGPPVPAFRPTRYMVKRAREGFIRDSKVQCTLDKRERTLHCHHEKIIVVDGDLAFVGGIDLTSLQADRFDEESHPPRDPLGWHDAAAHLPAREEPSPAGDVGVQVLRTVPEQVYTFAPRGEFTILGAYLHALTAAERFIYLENQFLWSPEVVDILCAKLTHPPSDDFRLLLLLPARPSPPHRHGAGASSGPAGPGRRP